MGMYSKRIKTAFARIAIRRLPKLTIAVARIMAIPPVLAIHLKSSSSYLRFSMHCCGRLFLLGSRRRRFGSQSLQAQFSAQIGFQFGGDISIVFQELFHILAALPDTFAAIAEPCPGLLHHVFGYAQVHQIAF